MTNVIVFCGARSGNHPKFEEAAAQFGKALAGAGAGLVYGGACIGLMGTVADAVNAAGGHTTGVIPEFMMVKEIAHSGLTELIVVESMHERKHKMFELGDAVVAFPGGWGTMDELFELLTWRQIGLHRKTIVLFNQDGFYDHLLAQCHEMAAAGFLSPELIDGLLIAGNVDEIMGCLGLAN